MGRFPVDGTNPNGGSIALGHPFGVTGASVKELTAMPAGRGALSRSAQMED